MTSSPKPWYESRKSEKPIPGDLVIVRSANEKINAYVISRDFSFANVAFNANNGEMGIVLDYASSENGSVLYHYVKVLFQRGMMGIVHSGLLMVITPKNEDEIEFSVL